MESLYFLVPIALIFIAIALRILFWAIHNGQYDNLDTEAHRILFEDNPPAAANPPSNSNSLNTSAVSSTKQPCATTEVLSSSSETVSMHDQTPKSPADNHHD